MSSPISVEQRIIGLMREKMAIDVPSAEADSITTGYLDSLTLVELLRHIESELGYVIRLEDLEIDQLRTVAKIAELVAKKGDERHRPPDQEETNAGRSSIR